MPKIISNPNFSKPVDIVIISYNTCNLTLQCIDSIIKTTSNLNIRLTLVDNSSVDDTLERVMEIYPQVRIIKNNENFGYSKALNIGVKQCDSEIIITCNSDVIYHENSISELLNYIYEHPDTGLVGPQQVFPGMKWELSYGYIPGIGCGLKRLFNIEKTVYLIDKLLLNKRIKSGKPKEVGYIDGAIFVFRRKAYIDLGGFDEDFFFYTDDIEFSHRLHLKNWKVIFLPTSVVTHIRGASSAKIGFDKEKLITLVQGRVLFCKKYRSKFVTKTYILIEKFHNLKMLFFWKFIKLFLFGKTKKFAVEKYNMFKMFFDAWKNEYKKFNIK